MCQSGKVVYGHQYTIAPASENHHEIIHPDHYTEGRNIEPLEVIEDWKLDFHLGNAVKYISRAGRKPGASMETDLKKAIFYIERKLKEVQ